MSGFLDATASLEQLAGLVGDANVKAEIIVGSQIVDNLLGEMMHVDHDTLIAS